MTPALQIYLLGEFRILRSNIELAEEAWSTKQARQLLKRLLTANGKIVPTDQLINDIWPDADPAKASTTLRTAINALRNTLEPNRPPYTRSSFIITARPGYRFQTSEHVWIDVDAFTQHLNQAGTSNTLDTQITELNHALALYRDDYLSDDLYADWTLAQRERLQTKHLDALLTLADCHLRRREFEPAIASLRRVLAREAGHEPAYRRLMQAHALGGNTVAALRAFDHLRTYLIEELGADPSPQTLQLHQAILNGHLVPPDKTTPLTTSETRSDTIFVGRRAEVAQLQPLLEMTSPPLVVALAGEAGVGKTALANVLLENATPQSMNTLTVRCQAIEQTLPFSPLIEALEVPLQQVQHDLHHLLSDPELAGLSSLFPTLSWQVTAPSAETPSSEDRRRQVVNSLVRLLRYIAQKGLILFVDDLQWVDEGTLAVLASLIRRRDTMAIRLLIAYRTEEVAQNKALQRWLRTLQHDSRITALNLSRLNKFEVQAYLEKLALPLNPDAIQHLYSLTGGNPLFLTELLRAWQDQQTERNPQQLDIQTLVQNITRHPGTKISDVILSRLEQLSAEERQVLRLSAVIGRDFSVTLLETVTTTDPSDTLDYLLERQFLIEVSVGRLDFSHQLVREVIYTQLSPLNRQRFHQRIAQALIVLYGQQAGPRAADIAHHSRRGGTALRRQASVFAVLAGDYALQTYGFRQAEQYYSQTLATAETQGLADWINRAYAGLGWAQEAQANWDAAEATYRQWNRWALQKQDRSAALSAQNRLASMLGLIGQLDESAAITARLTEQLPVQTPAAILEAQTRIQLLITAKPAFSLPDADWPGFQAHPCELEHPWLSIVAALGERQAPQSLNLFGWALLLQGQLDMADVTINHAAELAHANNQAALEATSHHLLAQLWDLRGNYNQMAQAHTAALALVQNAPEHNWAVIWGRIHQAYVDMRWNQLERAEARLHQLSRELATRTAFRSHRLSVEVGLGLLALFRRKLDVAQAHLNTALENPKNLYANNYVVAHLCQARINRYRRNWPASRAYIQQALEFAGSRGMPAEYISAVVEAARFDEATGQLGKTYPLLKTADGLAIEAALQPAQLSVTLALMRHDSQRIEAYQQQAQLLRDTIAATIPSKDDRSTYLSRYHL